MTFHGFTRLMKHYHFWQDKFLDNFSFSDQNICPTENFEQASHFCRFKRPLEIYPILSSN